MSSTLHLFVLAVVQGSDGVRMAAKWVTCPDKRGEAASGKALMILWVVSRASTWMRGGQ